MFSDTLRCAGGHLPSGDTTTEFGHQITRQSPRAEPGHGIRSQNSDRCHLTKGGLYLLAPDAALVATSRLRNTPQYSDPRSPVKAQGQHVNRGQSADGGPCRRTMDRQLISHTLYCYKLHCARSNLTYET